VAPLWLRPSNRWQWAIFNPYSGSPSTACQSAID
jgi:hypothetical protein